MIKKIVLFWALFFLQPVCAIAKGNCPDRVLGYDTCLSSAQLSRHDGHWVVDSADWKVSNENTKSLLTQLPNDATVDRSVKPHRSLTYKLADVTCNYQSGTVVLTRTYEEKSGPYPTAKYIAADKNIVDDGGFSWSSFWWNYDTKCTTTINSLDKCNWAFIFSSDCSIGPI